MSPDSIPFYPDLNPEKQKEAEENLVHFVEILFQIHERIEASTNHQRTLTEKLGTLR